LLGPGAPGLSAATVRRLTSAWQGEHERWQDRDLSARRFVYVWADGVYFRPRLDHERQCVLVLIGADETGRKELLAIDEVLSRIW
jgi:transposase-like protein